MTLADSGPVPGTGTPEHLIPRMGTLPVSSARHYRTATVVKVIAPPSETQPLHQALTPPPPARVLAGLPAEGVLLTHEQSWILAGTALGPLLHSLCLAPGEITQIAVHSQSAKVASRSVDAGLQAEDLTQTGRSSADQTDSESTSAAESTVGGTVASSASASMQMATGGLAGLIGVQAGGSMNTALAMQAAWSTGHRDVAETANQSVHQAATDQAHLHRAQHAAAVREVAESDRLEVSTRVVANYNHMHALTMEYFEVEQVYQLRTRVVDAERLLFVPMGRIDFADVTQRAPALERYRTQIIAAAEDLGLADVVAKLRSDRLSERPVAERLTDVTTAITAATTAHQSASEDLAAKLTAYEDALDRTATARDAVRTARDGTLEARSKAQRALDHAIADETAAGNALTASRAVRDRRSAELDGLNQQFATLLMAAKLEDEHLFSALAEHELAVNQGIWLRIDPSVYAGLLAHATYQGDRLGDTIDPNPVAVAGDMVGFRWRFRTPAEEAGFRARHLASGTLEQSVSVPTGGVFGEAVLGSSISAERIDLTRFWNWKDALPPIRPTAIAPQQAWAPTSLDAPTTTGNVPAAHLDLGPVSFPQTSSGIDRVASILAHPDLFDDLSGQETTAALAASAIELTTASAGEAQKLANDNFKRFMAFQRSVARSLHDAAKQAQQADKVDPTMAGGVLNHRTDAAAEAAGDPAAGAEVGAAAKGPSTQVTFDKDPAPPEKKTAPINAGPAPTPAGDDTDEGIQGGN